MRLFHLTMVHRPTGEVKAYATYYLDMAVRTFIGRRLVRDDPSGGEPAEWDYHSFGPIPGDTLPRRNPGPRSEPAGRPDVA